jgi:hypothetical protein
MEATSGHLKVQNQLRIEGGHLVQHGSTWFNYVLQLRRQCTAICGLNVDATNLKFKATQQQIKT